MPLHDRRPQLLSISIKPHSLSVKQDDALRTPNPTTPLTFAQQVPGPMIMTPDTPYFDTTAGGGFFTKHQLASMEDHKWTQEEDELLSSYLDRRATSGIYPPGTMPPPEILDAVTTALLSKMKMSRSSSMSSLDSTSSMDSDVCMGSPSPDNATTSGWNHSWAATRARLHKLALRESRGALGGHSRNKSDSMIDAPAEVLQDFSTAARCRQRSADSVLVTAPQTTGKAIMLSAPLQGHAMEGSSVLHSNQALSSPLDFGSDVYFSSGSTTPTAPVQVQAIPRLTTSRKVPPSLSLPQNQVRPKSLLSRGRSYTGADMAREHGHSRDNSIGSDVATNGDTDNERGMDDSPMGPTSRPMMRRTASSPISFVFPQAMTAISAVQVTPDTEEEDPITPLNQTSFPQSVFGLGPRRLTGSSELESPPAPAPEIILTSTSPASSPTPGGGRRAGYTIDIPAFANMRINAPHSPPRAPAVSVLAAPSGPLRRANRPPPLGRSASESIALAGLAQPNPAQLPASVSISAGLNTHLGPTPAITPISRPALSMTLINHGARHSEGSRETKRQRGTPLGSSGATVSRPRPNPGLMVAVPSLPLGFGVLARDGLRSPFEPNAAGGAI